MNQTRDRERQFDVETSSFASGDWKITVFSLVEPRLGARGGPERGTRQGSRSPQKAATSFSVIKLNQEKGGENDGRIEEAQGGAAAYPPLLPPAAAEGQLTSGRARFVHRPIVLHARCVPSVHFLKENYGSWYP